MKKIFPVLILAIMAIFILAGSAYGDEIPTAREIFDKMEKVNPNLKDFSSEITVKLDGSALFLPIHLDLKGKYFYKKPDKHKLELEKAPKFLSKYPQIFGWHLPELEKHKTLVKDVMIDDLPCWKITLIPIEGRGDIVQEDIWVNKKNYTFPRNLTTYRNDAYIQVDVKYRNEGENSLFDKMTAEFYFPKVKVKATAAAGYSNYKVNIGLTDDFFLTDEDKRKIKEEQERKKAEAAAKKQAEKAKSK
ncbi:MAG: hypothetical protein M1269_01490 [Chloroflexi bacterium]|nr:hypothetical protein [Chloroflexota bacterium]